MRHILVMRLSAMGDVALSVPVVASVLQQYPDVHITFLSNPRFAAMFEGLPRLEFFGVDTKNKYKGFFGIFSLWHDLRKLRHFEVMVDLHDVLRSMVLRSLFRMSGVPFRRIDKGRQAKKALVAQGKDKVLQPLKSSVQRYADVFAAAGLSVQVQFEGLFQKSSVSTPLGAKQGYWVGIAPFAQHTGKIYPLHLMLQAVQLLAAMPDVHLFFFGGGAQEKSVLQDWQNQVPGTTSLAGKYPLATELQIISQCDALVSMDSANMHLASLVGTPVVSVWGATHPFAGFYGYHQKESNIVQVDGLDCRPCSIYGNKPCLRGDYACLNNIPPSLIVEKVKSLL